MIIKHQFFDEDGRVFENITFGCRVPFAIEVLRDQTSSHEPDELGLTITDAEGVALLQTFGKEAIRDTRSNAWVKSLYERKKQTLTEVLNGIPIRNNSVPIHG